MLDDPLRTPPGARTREAGVLRDGAVTAPPTARGGLPSLDHRAEQLRLATQQILDEPVLTLLVGSGLPPRKWPALAALGVAGLGAAFIPFSGIAPIVFWGTAFASAYLWRQHQEGRFPRRSPQPAGALAITPSRLALIAVRRGWFRASLEATEVLTAEPLDHIIMHNRVGWGRIEVGGRPLYLDASSRRATVAAVNALIDDVASGGWHAVPFRSDASDPTTATATAPAHRTGRDAARLLGESSPAPFT